MAKDHLGEISTEALKAELLRREGPKKPMTLEALEQQAEERKRDFGLEFLQNHLRSPEDGNPKRCPKCGKHARVREKEVLRKIMTLSGEVDYRRNRHYCEHCTHNFFPRDADLELSTQGRVSPEMERRLLDFGINDPFEEATQRFNVHYEIEISTNLMKLVTTRVGVECTESEPLYLQQTAEKEPSVPKEEDTLIVQMDGSMLRTREEGWKEAKLGILYALGDSISRKDTGRGLIMQAWYACALGGQEEFQKELDAALEAEEYHRYKRVVAMGDGAKGIWRMFGDLLPGATEILDFAHAAQHGIDLGKVLLLEDEYCVKLWKRRMETLLLAGDTKALLDEIKDCIEDATDAGLKAINDLVRYYRNNRKRMHYAKFLRMGLPIGTGAVESAQKHVLQKRMKQSGQSWSKPRACAMAKMRAHYRTVGPQRLRSSIRQAHFRTRQQPRVLLSKRRASNR